jgi:hypothetical protein
MKTLIAWENSKLCLSNFLNIGDQVDEDLVEYVLCVLPPATWTKECIQMGEPYNHDNLGRACYLTLEKPVFNGLWIYAGIKPRPKK